MSKLEQSLSPALAEAIERLARFPLPPHRPPTLRRGRGLLGDAVNDKPGGDDPDSALGIAARVRSDPSCASQLISAALERATATRELNAFITLDRNAVESSTGTSRGCLAGVPVAHKDIIDVAGISTTAGSRSRADLVPQRSASLVRALQAAGAVCVGKTNTHELATGVTGEVSAAGRVANPWAHERMAGGSSSGSAAAVAAGVVPLATATDTGGSARIPAACCGVVGLKASYGSVDMRGVLPFSWTLDHAGFIARHADDVAVALAAATGASTTGGARGLDGLRFAMPEAPLADADAAVASAVTEASRWLERLGARRVAPAWPEIFDHANGIAATIFLPEGAAVHQQTLRTRPADLEPPTRDFLASAAAIGQDTYLRALTARHAAIAAADEYFAQVDVLLTPTLPCAAPRRDAETVPLPDGDVDARAALTRYTRLWNVCGNPALSVPVTLDSGLPLAAQLVGPYGADMGIARVAALMERERGYLGRPAAS